MRQHAARTTGRWLAIPCKVKGRDIIALAGGLVALVALIALWRARPSDEFWLLGTLVWAGITYPAFFWYVTRN